MFFYLSKILAFFMQPSNVIMFLVLLGVLLQGTRFSRLGKRSAILGAALLLICGLSPLGHALILPLEERFPAQQPGDINAPTGIIVLGGGISGSISVKRNQLILNSAGERIVEFMALAKAFPDAKLVFTGGSNAIFSARHAESDSFDKFYLRSNFDPERLILESKSRNTYENALFTKNLVTPKPGEKWLLITSAYHMPRAVGCFRQVGFDVIPYPIDYRTEGYDQLGTPFNKVSEGLRRVDTAFREWVGIVAYRLTNRTSALFPAP